MLESRLLPALESTPASRDQTLQHTSLGTLHRDAWPNNHKLLQLTSTWLQPSFTPLNEDNMLPATLQNNLTPPPLVALTKSQLIGCPAGLFPLCARHPQKPIKMMLPCSFPRFSNVPSCEPQHFLLIFPPSLQVPVPPLAWDESQFPRQLTGSPNFYS